MGGVGGVGVSITGKTKLPVTCLLVWVFFSFKELCDCNSEYRCCLSLKSQ